jgi:hypothetical protein
MQGFAQLFGLPALEQRVAAAINLEDHAVKLRFSGLT